MSSIKERVAALNSASASAKSPNGTPLSRATSPSSIASARSASSRNRLFSPPLGTKQRVLGTPDPDSSDFSDEAELIQDSIRPKNSHKRIEELGKPTNKQSPISSDENHIPVVQNISSERINDHSQSSGRSLTGHDNDSNREPPSASSVDQDLHSEAKSSNIVNTDDTSVSRASRDIKEQTVIPQTLVTSPSHHDIRSDDSRQQQGVGITPASKADPFRLLESQASSSDIADTLQNVLLSPISSRRNSNSHEPDLPSRTITRSNSGSSENRYPSDFILARVEQKSSESADAGVEKPAKRLDEPPLSPMQHHSSTETDIDWSEASRVGIQYSLLICVQLSGAESCSLTLTLLARLQRNYPKQYSMVSQHRSAGMSGN